MAIRLDFGLMDSMAAGMIGVPMASLHLDVDAMIRAADALAPLADRLGIKRPAPALAGLGYVHVSTLGAQVVISPDAAEPYVIPCIRTPEDIDRLVEPEDYLSAGVVPQRLELARQLKARRPDARTSIGHDTEGPVTTAVLLMGQDFFMLPYDDPKRAHKLLELCTRSSINYARAVSRHNGRQVDGGAIGIPDDFAGMFPPRQFREFVLPYWRMFYGELHATRRNLHCELLHEEHMPFLDELRIDSYDPSVDQYLPAEAMKRSCRVPYGLRIWPAWVQDRSAQELVVMLHRFAADDPMFIMFHMHRLRDEPKIAALLAAMKQYQ